MSNGYYILKDKKPIACDVHTWSRFFEKIKNRIVKQETIEDSEISTVFLGMDHRFMSEGDPLIFETMIFGGKHDQYCDRCSTWEQAEDMHKKAVEMVVRAN